MERDRAEGAFSAGAHRLGVPSGGRGFSTGRPPAAGRRRHNLLRQSQLSDHSHHSAELVFGRPLTTNLLTSSPPGQSPALEFDAIRSIERHVSGYLLTITSINCVLGVVVAAVMALLEIPNPLLWGVMATVVNFIPYLGAMVGAVILAVVGLVSFEETGRALLPALIYYGITVTEGTIVTPIILGRTHRLNPLVLFVWLILWGWLWGIMGALLAVPMLVTFKIICDSLPQYKRLATIIGRS